MRSYRSTLATLIVAGISATVGLQAQTVTTGAISGKVLDTAGNVPVAGATVRATSGQVTRTVVTNTDGSFVLSLLNGGTWSVQVTKPSYASAKQHVQVMVNSVVSTNFKIAKESAVTVEVVASSSTLDTSTTTTGNTYSLGTIADLPVGNSLSNIAMLTPGVSASGFTSSYGYGLDIAIAGASGAENSFSVDGLTTNDMRYGGQGASVMTEFIDQVDIQTGGYKPEFSALGGVFNVTTKSGSNEFQGTAWTHIAPASMKTAPKGTLWYSETAATTVWDAGAWVGGPIIKDKLFYSVGLGYETTEVPSYGNNTGNEVGSESIPNVQYFSKFNYFINPDNQLTLSFFGNQKKDTRENAAATANALGGYGDENSGYTEKNTTSNFNIIWDSALASNMNISVKAGRFNLGNKLTPADNSSRVYDYTTYFGTALSGVPYVTGGGGSVNDDETNVSNQFSADLSWFLGNHALKFGFSYQDSEYKVDETYAGGSSWYLYPAEYGGTGWAARAYQRVYWNHSKAKANFMGIYAQDGWQVTNGLNLYYGFRMEQQEQKAGSDGHTFMKFDFLDYIQPRLGFTWDLEGNGKSKLSGNFGIYYEKIPQRMAARTYGNEYYHRFRYYDYTYDTTTHTVTPTSPASQDVDYSTGWSNDPIADDLKLPKRTEILLGFDRQVTEHTTVGIHAKYRKLTDIIEDSVLTDAEGGTLDTSDTVGQAIIWNPKKGKVSWTNTSGDKVTVDNTLIPEGYNEYKSLDVTYTWKTDDSMVSASYTWSRNYGTYEGLISPSNGQADGNITASFDYYPYVGTGLLPTDHTHSFKIFGTHKFHFRSGDTLTVGANFLAQSGVPYSWKDDGSTSSPALPDVGLYGNSTFKDGKMGNMGRTPWVKQMDVSAQYELPLSGKIAIMPMVEVFNLFNARVATQVEEEAADQNGVLYTGGRWGSATGYQARRYFRFGMKVKF
nr:carboxypeptidase regulatory-like domain-containing protein [uncultured Holophaga sp.]